MNLNLSENIRAYRRKQNLTQEQLAESLGVTVGAISKWESGATTPEIETLVRIADFFDLSVDALLGWRLEGDNLNESIARIRSMIAEKDFDSAISLGEKLLQKHPNHFTVVYQTGMAHFAKGSFIGSKAALDSIFRAQTLLNRALALFDQNADPSMTEWQIRTILAEIHLYLWDLEEAVKIFRENNPGGVNDSRIAQILSDILHRPDEALPYIERSFQRLMQDLICTMISLSGYFFYHKDHERDLDSVLWIIRTLESLRPADGFCDLDPLITTLMQAMCEIHLWHYYDPVQAKEWMKRAYRAAKAYDAALPGEIVGCRFLDDRLDVSRFHTNFFGNGSITESLTQRLHWAKPEDEPEYYRIFEQAIREVDEEESP